MGVSSRANFPLTLTCRHCGREGKGRPWSHDLDLIRSLVTWLHPWILRLTIISHRTKMLMSGWPII